LLTNGAFSTTSGWTKTGNFFFDSRFLNYRSSPGYAYLSNSDGTRGDNLSGTLYQTVTIPSDATSATLTYWISIATDEISTVNPYDFLTVTVRNSSGSLLGTIASLSNLDKWWRRQRGHPVVQVSQSILIPSLLPLMLDRLG
jgi:hypothetical protein